MKLASTTFSESESKASKLASQIELFKMEEEKLKLESEQEKQAVRKDLVATVATLEERQTELIEKLKVKPILFSAKRITRLCKVCFQATQKQLGNERMSRLQNERETDRKDQEIQVLKALLAKLQKYSHEGNDAAAVVSPPREKKVRLICESWPI